jgi:hypothetical protein
MVFLYSLIGYIKDKHHFHTTGLYISAFFIPLVSPAYAAGVMIIVFLYLVLPKLKSLFGYLLDRNKNKLTIEFLHPFGLILVIMISFSLWSVRNYVVFKSFIPVKSNLWYEFYLANIVDEDGIVSRSSMYKSHPFLNQSVRNEMARYGEYIWLQKFKDLGTDYLEKNSTDYIKNVSNRIFNAFIFTENVLDLVQSEYLNWINEIERQKLLDHKLIFDDRWNHFHLDREEFIVKFNELKLRDKGLLIQDWLKAKERYIRFKYSLPNILRGILIGLVPTLCIVALLSNRRLKINREAHYIIILYLIYLLPYILISHQIRYQRELFSLQILLISITLNSYLTKPTNKSFTDAGFKYFSFKPEKNRTN